MFCFLANSERGGVGRTHPAWPPWLPKARMRTRLPWACSRRSSPWSGPGSRLLQPREVRSIMSAFHNTQVVSLGRKQHQWGGRCHQSTTSIRTRGHVTVRAAPVCWGWAGRGREENKELYYDPIFSETVPRLQPNDADTRRDAAANSPVMPQRCPRPTLRSLHHTTVTVTRNTPHREKGIVFLPARELFVICCQ